MADKLDSISYRPKPYNYLVRRLSMSCTRALTHVDLCSESWLSVHLVDVPTIDRKRHTIVFGHRLLAFAYVVTAITPVFVLNTHFVRTFFSATGRIQPDSVSGFIMLLYIYIYLLRYFLYMKQANSKVSFFVLDSVDLILVLRVYIWVFLNHIKCRAVFQDLPKRFSIPR